MRDPFNQTIDIVSLGCTCQHLGVKYDQLLSAMALCGVEPAYKIDGVGYLTAADIHTLKTHFDKQKR
jgi:hypothetical protein